MEIPQESSFCPFENSTFCPSWGHFSHRTSQGQACLRLLGANFFSEPYLKAINALVKQKPDLSPKDDLFSVFTGWFLRYSLEMPLGVGTSKNEERIRIGNRIKEIREEKKIEAKTLAMLTGIDAANLCRIEQGKQSAGIDVLSKIANAMGYKIEFVELKKN